MKKTFLIISLLAGSAVAGPLLGFYAAQATAGASWVWYVSRASGLLAFVFLWLTVFLGLAIRNPSFKRIISPFYSLDFHSFMGAMALFWSLVHGSSFLLHNADFSFSLPEVALPFYSKTALVDVNFMALGILAFYGLVILGATSYLRNHLSHSAWRIIHFLNPIVFLFVVFHGLVVGTDTKQFLIGWSYILASLFLALIYLENLFFRLYQKFSSKF